MGAGILAHGNDEWSAAFSVYGSQCRVIVITGW